MIRRSSEVDHRTSTAAIPCARDDLGLLIIRLHAAPAPEVGEPDAVAQRQETSVGLHRHSWRGKHPFSAEAPGDGFGRVAGSCILPLASSAAAMGAARAASLWS